MKIPVGTARAIVQEISRAVNQDVNLMDQTGRIIASTNPDRVGTEHVGAKKIIEEHLDCLTIGTDQEYSGSKMGINMPVSFAGETVGVIGISGEWSSVSRYVRLIRRVTEVLLMDAYLQESEGVARTRMRSYLHDLLFEDPARLPEDFFLTGKSIGVDAELPRRCVCLSFCQEDGGCPGGLQAMLDDAERALKRAPAGTVNYREAAQLCVFVPEEGNVGLVGLIGELAKSVPLPPGMQMKAGVDGGPHTGADLRIGRAQAEKSLRAALTSGQSVVLYATMTSGIYLGEVSHAARREYIERVFAEMNMDEIRGWIPMLEMFYECDGSISKAAERLFVHKNTLQYQLKKLASLTGYDPRSIANAGLYQTAILFYRSLSL